MDAKRWRQVRCKSCRQRHSGDVCPPHEVRTTGVAWFRERIADLGSELAQLRERSAREHAAWEAFRSGAVTEVDSQDDVVLNRRRFRAAGPGVKGWRFADDPSTPCWRWSRQRSGSRQNENDNPQEVRRRV